MLDFSPYPIIRSNDLEIPGKFYVCTAVMQVCIPVRARRILLVLNTHCIRDSSSVEFLNAQCYWWLVQFDFDCTLSSRRSLLNITLQISFSYAPRFFSLCIFFNINSRLGNLDRSYLTIQIIFFHIILPQHLYQCHSWILSYFFHVFCALQIVAYLELHSKLKWDLYVNRVHRLSYR